MAQRYYHGLQHLRTGFPLSTSGTSLVGDCKGRCQQPILIICVLKCIQRGATFLRQPVITSLIAAEVCKRGYFCAWRSFSILNKSRCFEYYVSIFLSFAYYYHVYPVISIIPRLFLLGVAISMLRSVIYIGDLQVYR